MADRDFKGVWIPKSVWLDTRLNALDKIILVEIDSLDSTEKGCWKTNEGLAEFCQCSATKVSLSVSKLIELGYLYVLAFDGRKRYLKSSLSKNEKQPFKNCEAAFQNLKDSNTLSNPLSNPTKSLSSDDDAFDGFSEFWSAYPRKDGKDDARKAWKALKPDRELQEAILADIKRRLDTDGAWHNTERRFIKMPGPYLRGKRWEDEGGAKEIARHREPDRVVLTAEEEAIIDEINRNGWNYG